MKNTIEFDEIIIDRGEGLHLAYLFFVVPFIILHVQYCLYVRKQMRIKRQFRAVIRSTKRNRKGVKPSAE
ncbi:unnamed protein product [Caenorhabditis sp. 36 PRJEB53466]|nr:unnamed protein product [Caenorhabditis sp. 36 PRJEB53466]